MAKRHGNMLGAAICKAVGVDPKMVRALTLRCSASDVATIDFECYVDTEHPDDIADVLLRYELVEREQS